MKRKTLEEFWYQVPPNYYEKGIKTNLFQFIWHNWKWLTMKKILQNLNPTPTKILDIGCASGCIAARIASLLPNAEIYGLDSYDRAINLGKKFHPEIKFIIGDAHELPFSKQTFDLVICIETLEHLENPTQALQEMKRVLAPKGKILIGQDTDKLLFRLIWFFWTKMRGKVWQNSHIHTMKAKKLEKLVKKTGFKIRIKKFSQAGLEIFC